MGGDSKPCQGDRAQCCLAEEFLPLFDIETSHGIHIRAPTEAVYDATRNLDLSGSRLVRTLFALRGLPACTLDAQGLTQLRFTLLREEPHRGIAFGLIGRFWTIKGSLMDFQPDGFAGFRTAGYAKAVWTFEITSDDNAVTQLTTVTRVLCLDEASRRQFMRYWFVIRPFSGAIRRVALETIKAQAEGAKELSCRK